MAVYQSGIIFADVDTADPQVWHLKSYEERGGYQALKKIRQSLKIPDFWFTMKL